jgi:ribosomal protein S18 acetylase RimI-like enzyme
MTLRPAGPEDAPSLARILVRTWRERYPGLVGQRVLDGLDEQRFATYFAESLAPATGHGATIASVDGEAAGFIHFGPDEDDSTRGHVFSFYVLPSFSGRGLGRELLGHVLRQLAARGFRAVTLWVFKDNAPTVRLYERAGFLADGRERVEPEYGLVEQRMELDLEGSAG